LASAARTKVDFQIETVPADGNGLPFLRSGEFGTSPFFRQLSAKVIRAMAAITIAVGSAATPVARCRNRRRGSFIACPLDVSDCSPADRLAALPSRHTPRLFATAFQDWPGIRICHRPNAESCQNHVNWLKKAVT
jgi:hypothetical protein